MIARYALMCVALGAAALWHAACLATPADAVYTTTVRLHDGKDLVCDVNPQTDASDAQAPPARLTQKEQREAEVIATYRLRLLSGPRSDFPTAYTAPHVVCRSAAD